MTSQWYPAPEAEEPESAPVAWQESESTDDGYDYGAATSTQNDLGDDHEESLSSDDLDDSSSSGSLASMLIQDLDLDQQTGQDSAWGTGDETGQADEIASSWQDSSESTDGD